MKTCYECAQPIAGEVIIGKVWNDELYELMREPFHLDCLDNDKRPDEYRVCETCGLTGKDTQGRYPSPFDQPFIQHADCVDWDNIRKYKE